MASKTMAACRNSRLPRSLSNPRQSKSGMELTEAENQRPTVRSRSKSANRNEGDGQSLSLKERFRELTSRKPHAQTSLAIETDEVTHGIEKLTLEGDKVGNVTASVRPKEMTFDLDLDSVADSGRPKRKVEDSDYSPPRKIPTPDPGETTPTLAETMNASPSNENASANEVFNPKVLHICHLG